MSSRAIKPRRDLSVERSAWQGLADRAPSIVREEGPALPRYVAVVSLMLLTLGGASLLFPVVGWRYLIPTGIGFLMLSLGLAGMLYHAFNEKDFQFRRIYGVFGFLLLLVGIFLRLVPLGPDKIFGWAFMPYGGFSLLLSLGFLLSFARNESEISLRRYAVVLVGLVALANVLAGFIGSVISERFLGQTGIIHLVLGLLFGVGYVGMEGISSKRGFFAGRAIGVFGLAMVLVAVGRSLWPYLWQWLNWRGDPPTPFFLPSGLVLSYMGIEYILMYLGICSDNRLIVLARRELASFFFSPIIYVVMIGMVVIGWLNFWVFVEQIRRSMAAPEPIFFQLMVNFLFIIPLVFLVPIITMRMLSEEKRTGTLEVLLSAPVNEWHIVLAKFFAGLRVFLLCWYLWGVFLIALWSQGGEFDYRPVVTFWLALVFMAANFIAMGLFFSSLTRHQILSAVLTFMMMMVLTVLFILGQFITGQQWLDVLIANVSYIDLWISSARSTITPRLLVLNFSMAVLWIYLTIKVLEARKWS